ncbi:MAG: hypothetical protein Q8Q37_01095 [bacterium]|nr:hypothetical protein [bacterium]
MDRSSGVTLIEVVIYTGIVAIFLALSFLVVGQFLEYGDRLQISRNLNETQRFIVQKFNWAMSGAQNINEPSLGSSGVVLSIDKTGFAENPLVLDSFDGVLRLTSGINQPVELNHNAVISDLLFEHLDFSGQSAIRMTATLTNDFASTTIDTTVIYE